MLSLHGMGMFNSITPGASGEKFFLQTVCKHLPAAVVFDIGANQGFYAKMIKSVSTCMQIYAFEPHPKTYKKLEKVAERYQFESFNIGFGEEEKQSALYDYINQDGSTHASLYREVIENIHHGKAIRHLVDIDTIDHFAKEHQIRQIDLLKIDTEGNELNVLKGARKTLSEGRIQCIQFEFGELNAVSEVFMNDFMKLLPQYSFYRLLTDGWVLLDNSHPVYREIFGYQNVVAVHRQSLLFPVFMNKAIE